MLSFPTNVKDFINRDRKIFFYGRNDTM